MGTKSKITLNGHEIRFERRNIGGIYQNVYKPHVGTNGRITFSNREANAYIESLFTKGLSRYASISGFKNFAQNEKEIEMIRIETIKGQKIWRGDPTDTVQIEEWKRSFEPGFVPRIISPRDKYGQYTDDPKQTVGYVSMDQKTHAREIAIRLQKEPTVPMSIIDTLRKKLDVGTKSNPPVGQTKTNATDAEAQSRNLTNLTSGKLTAIVIALFVLIFFILKLDKTRG